MTKKVPDKGFTHGSKFHSDDVFSTAFLQILNPDFQVERGFEVPEDYDGIVYDIGRGKYDHHQKDKRIRENGVPFAAFGLLWEEFGTEILSEEEAARFDEKFIQPLDLSDNTGCFEVLAEVIAQFNPGWDSDASYDDCFFKAVAVAKQILENYFDKVKGSARARKIIEKAMEECDGTILILPCFAPWKSWVTGSSYKFTVYPSNRGGYSIQGVPVSEDSQELVCSFPEEWRGKASEELQQATGIESFRFCHPSGFLSAANTKEDAIAIAKLALK